MLALSENRSSDDLPRELHDVSMRRSLGRAAEVLSLWRSTGVKPENATQVLQTAAAQLDSPIGTTGTAEQARSLGTYGPQIQLLAHARAAFPTESLQGLREVSQLLTTLATAEGRPEPGLDTAVEKLRQLRHAMAKSRTRSAERQERQRRR